MSDKAMQKSLSDIVTEVTKNTKVLDDIQTENKIVLELLNTIYQRVEDMSRKFDEVLNSGIKKPKLTPSKKDTTSTTNEEEDEEEEPVPKKKKAAKKDSSDSGKMIKNIMTYFKVKYTEDPTYFNDIFEENQVESVFAQNAEDLNNKKGAGKLKSQISFLYKNLNKNQKKKVREKMMDENDKPSGTEENDIEEDVVSD
jgi:hypothetical protein